jgi:hypothetical protein
MALKKEVYRALEDIVGPQNISDDPAVLDTYRYSMANTALHMGPHYHVYTPRGAAVLMPGCTEEVSNIIKICNKYKIRFKPSSTFWSGWGFPLEDDTIQLDMRRMDRVLKIDEKNMYAVIEPHVIGAILQAEAMKVGLNTHIHGPGSSCSLLASSTSLGGLGPSTIYMGGNTENIVGVEWVMSNGDILRTGALGNTGCPCSEGPGPSLRGLVRGAMGAHGTMGVYTKVALKLYPWPGPTTLCVEGRPPAYKAVLPDLIRGYTLAFPTWQAWADSCYLIWDAGIGYIAHRQYSMFGRDLKGAMIKILTNPNGTLSDIDELVKDPKIQKMSENMTRDYQIVIAGHTRRDIEWQEKALDRILEITGGWKVKEMIDDPDIYGWSLLYMVRLGHKNLNLVYGGGYDGCFGLGGPPDYGTQHVEEATDFKREWEKKGTFVAAGGDGMMGGVGGMGGGGLAMWENFTHFDPFDKESTDGTTEFFNETAKFGVKMGWGVGMEKMNSYARGTNGRSTPKEVVDKMHLSMHQPSAARYQRKIREAFNPNKLGDAYYRELDDPPKSK